jgi:hypothetical protein
MLEWELANTRVGDLGSVPDHYWAGLTKKDVLVAVIRDWR